VVWDLLARARRPTVFKMFPGTADGLPAIDVAIFAVFPINVRLLFSRDNNLGAAVENLRGIERRIAGGLTPDVASVASLFVSRWDVAVAGDVPATLVNRLGIAVGQRVYRTYCDLIASPRYLRVLNAGARAQRLLLASTGTKDPKASDILYVKALAAPYTVNTMPEATLKAFADHGEVGAGMPVDGGDCESVLTQFARAGIDLDALASRLQNEGAEAFIRSWNDLIGVVAAKSKALEKAS
jgi:transaldolase